MSAQTNILTAIKAAEKGAFEYLPKPFDLDELGSIVERALTETSVDDQVHNINRESIEDTLPLIGSSPAMQDIYRTVARLMTTNLTVVITGESGTGKELVAKALHEYGKRREGPFVALNMAAIPRDLIESELFGHKKGAFTGAISSEVGRFEQAQHGTLFLDEIGDMPLDAQTRLLRVLQEEEYRPVGGKDIIKTDVRIIAATHRDLKGLIEKGQFREDLYYRLNVVPVRMPALRERRTDIPELVRHFLGGLNLEEKHVKTFDGDAMETLQNYNWPGNVRELENFIQRICVLYTDDTITSAIINSELDQEELTNKSLVVEDDNIGRAVESYLSRFFDAHDGFLPNPGLYDRLLKEFEEPLIRLSLVATKGNQIKTAQMLGINRNTLRKKIKELDIDVIRGKT
ncbi:MAG: nitrogen regulation protein NR(I), partial [Rhodospirillales bacterium]|nr:nitrogen regulation protein NR(I) [Rhodospirillales bacterium]